LGTSIKSEEMTVTSGGDGVIGYREGT